MGSLVPGWRSDSQTVPRELVEYKDDDEVKGYFAQYERDKQLRHKAAHDDFQESPFGHDAPHEQVGSPGRRSSIGSMPVPQRLGSFSRYANLESGAPASLRSSSLDSSVKDTTKGFLHKHKDQNTYPWWDRVDSAVFNDKPDLDLEDYRKGGYVPQYSVTGQTMNYVTKAAEGDDKGSDQLPVA